MGMMGRPAKHLKGVEHSETSYACGRILTLSERKKYLQLVTEGVDLVEACEKIGTSYDSLQLTRKKYSTFDEAVAIAKECTLDKVEQMLFKSALGLNTVKITKRVPLRDADGNRVIDENGNEVLVIKEEITKDVPPSDYAMQIIVAANLTKYQHKATLTVRPEVNWNDPDEVRAAILAKAAEMPALELLPAPDDDSDESRP